MKLNERIRGLREDKDLTQSELAKIFNVSQITISQYERGVRQLPHEIIIKYAKYFSVSIDYIFGMTDNPEPNYKIKNNVNINFGKIEMR